MDTKKILILLLILAILIGLSIIYTNIKYAPLSTEYFKGLKADNIEQAITATNPYAVDLSSGVETDGRKDRAKILEIVRRMRNG